MAPIPIPLNARLSRRTRPVAVFAFVPISAIFEAIPARVLTIASVL